MKYSFDSRVRYSEIGENGKLTLWGMINYFQDCSTFQSEEIGAGVEALRNMGRAWVLSSWQIHVRRYPALGEHVKVSTWASGFRRFVGGRSFIMETQEGELLSCANSVWAYVDIATGKPVQVPAEAIDAYGTEDPLEEDFGSRKIQIPEQMESREPFPVLAHNLDTNHHVNNGQFIYLAGEYLPEQFEVHKLKAEYKQQARLGDLFCPVVGREKDGCTVLLNDEKGSPYVVVEFR